ncbi:MAG: hypothetical protein P8016_17415 [Sedimentisphaerales bacterium]
MRLTKKKAIELTIEMWKFLAETGKEKGNWPGWKKYKLDRHYYENACFLCQWVMNQNHIKRIYEFFDDPDCKYCPLFKRTKESCYDVHSLYQEWFKVIDIELKKNHAKKLLEFMRKMK